MKSHTGLVENPNFDLAIQKWMNRFSTNFAWVFTSRTCTLIHAKFHYDPIREFLVSTFIYAKLSTLRVYSAYFLPIKLTDKIKDYTQPVTTYILFESGSWPIERWNINITQRQRERTNKQSWQIWSTGRHTYISYRKWSFYVKTDQN